jgi:hypothetical protein
MFTLHTADVCNPFVLFPKKHVDDNGETDDSTDSDPAYMSEQSVDCITDSCPDIQIEQIDSLRLSGNPTVKPSKKINTGELVDSQEDHSIHFGIVNIKSIGKKICNQPIAVLLSADCSGSMSDKSRDGRTKMQHVNHTLANIITLFASETDADISVCVDAFDDKIHPIFDFTKVTNENADSLISKIECIRPDGSTNIEIALTNSTTKIAAYRAKHPNHRIFHIMLTDGDATMGQMDPDMLTDVISNDTFSNIFIGYGGTHNANMLIRLSSPKNNEYRVVDKIEEAGMIYGEIVHVILYPAIDEAYITIEHGEIYDWRTNQWTDQINIPSFACEAEKTFQIRTTEPDKLTGEFRGKLCTGKYDELLRLPTGTTELSRSPSPSCALLRIPDRSKLTDSIDYVDEITILPDLHDENGNISEPSNLIPYMFRQRVQELLFEVREINDPRNHHNNNNIREKLKSFYTMMKKYVDENGMKTDPFMNVLLDDIYIAYKTFGTVHAQMYSAARQSSQGRQQTYNVTNVDELVDATRFASPIRRTLHNQPPALQRSMTLVRNDDNDNNNNHVLNNMTPKKIKAPKKIRIAPFPQLFNNDDDDDNDNINEYGDDENQDTQILNHIMSSCTNTSYASPSALKVMRALTGPIEPDDDDDEDNVASQSA